MTLPPSAVVHNERTKLTAGWLNTVAAASVIAGGVSPLVALAYGFTELQREAWVVAILSVTWILAGIGLHFVARAILGRLKP